jgi:hypothetical protein
MCVTEEEQNGTCYKAEDCTEKGGKAKVIIIIIIFIITCIIRFLNLTATTIIVPR